jgi:hypothetical protein
MAVGVTTIGTMIKQWIAPGWEQEKTKTHQFETGN